MAEIALDAVCSRKEQSSDSSYHKGFVIRAPVLARVRKINPTYPYILHTKRPNRRRLSNMSRRAPGRDHHGQVSFVEHARNGALITCRDDQRVCRIYLRSHLNNAD
jgi:hypothetical protein